MRLRLSVLVEYCSGPVERLIEGVEQYSRRSRAFHGKLERFLSDTGTIKIVLQALHTIRR
jgi:hypothetical protein